MPEKEGAQVECPVGAINHVAQGLQRLPSILVNRQLLKSGDVWKAHGGGKLPGLRCRFTCAARLVL
jgi:hypothetical protein